MNTIEGNNNETGLEVAVIGMAGRFPGARNIAQFWNNLKSGVESISFFTDEELLEAGIEPDSVKNPNYVKAKGMLEDIECFDSSFFDYSPREAEHMDPQFRILHECAWHTLEHAGYDPDSYTGAIGFYVGSLSNYQWVSGLLSRIDNHSEQIGIGSLNDRDFLSTRIAYKLNLKGPAVNVQTACSTSLVAIHLACQGLLSGESDMALAGGVSVWLPTKSGYLYEKGMVRSPDGRCRAFDAEAAGTNSGDAVALVLLKRLEDARTDGDNIYAVIKGAAINNDGKRKVGYTAPSVQAQAEVIQAALQMAEVEPESITYVEAHGTGTPLGDPVEVEALKRAFGTEKRQFCAIGSLKTNMGHLDAAAGVGGFIKTVLALKHRAIPPSLHYKNPNPAIDFENSPFYVNTQPREWKSNGYPLRAGVSSFGIGGTNAHAILEEAPETERSSKSRNWKLLLLSTKTQPALERASGNLLEFLKNNPGINLADAAYTLQVGRKAFEHRRMVVCSDVDNAIEALSPSTPSGKQRTFFTKEEKKSIVFMFPGLGAQYVNMGLDLYQTEPVFREEMDRCFDILNSLVDYNTKEILYPGEIAGAQGNETSGVDSFEMVQVAVFIFEYALARLIMGWGIKPRAMIGYSFGEYSAACVSGIFTLEDALKLIVSRGRLIKKMPIGAMLSVPLPAEELQAFLNDELSLAIDNGSSCIVAGSTSAVGVLEKQMKNEKYLCMPVQTSHAIHSKMMEPILREFEECVTEIGLNKPQIPYISNVTGKWITLQQAQDPHYWAAHLRNTVRFAPGINELMKEENSLFVEIGPGRDLSALVVRHIEGEPDIKVTNLVRHPDQNVSDHYFLLNKIGRLWLWGVKIDWNKFQSEEKRYRLPLPTYPFESHRYEIKCDSIEAGAKVSGKNALIIKKPDMADWFYIPSWKRSILSQDDKNKRPEKQGWLIFLDECGMGSMFVERLKEKGQDVVTVVPGLKYKRGEKSVYSIDPTQDDDYGILFNDLSSSNIIPDKIVHFWGVTEETSGDIAKMHSDPEFEWFNKAQDLGFYSLLNLAKAIGKKDYKRTIEIIVVTNNMQHVAMEGVVCPEKATLLGPLKVIPLEQPDIVCRSIDIVFPGYGIPEKQKKKIFEQLWGEFQLLSKSLDTVVALRDNYRWVQSFEPIRLEGVDDGLLPLREQGVYLITGGLGETGLMLAGYLAEHFNARLMLTGRSPIPPRDRWDEWLSEHGEDDTISQKITKLKHFEQLGAEVLVFQADAADREQMRKVVRQAELHFKTIHGVIHAAGITRGTSFGQMQKLNRTECQQQFQSKVYGLLILGELLKDYELDFCWVISSLVVFLGAPGFGAYAAANNFMDAYVSLRNRLTSCSWLCVNWEGMDINKTIEGFKRTLSLGEIDQVVVSSGGSQDERIDRWLKTKLESLRSEVDSRKDRLPPSMLKLRPALMNPYTPPRSPVEETLVDMWRDLFGIEKIGINDDFFELGGDSLKALTLLSKIQKELDVEIPITDFFSSSTIDRLAGFVRDTNKKSTYSPIRLTEKKEYYALSSAQKRLFVLQQMEKDSIVYNETLVVLLEGKVDKGKLEKTFRKLIRRHESLRTSIRLRGEKPVQKVHEEVEFEIEYFIPDSPHSTEEIIANVVRPFNLGKPPFLRLALIKLAAEQHVMVLDMHHIITDGVTRQIFIEELSILYENEDKELPTLTIQYKDYAEWQHSEKRQETFKKQEAFWLREFEDEIPVLNLPTDYPRSPIKSSEGSIYYFDLSGGETEALRHLVAQEEVTLFMALLSLFYILLSRLSGQEDIVVGSTTAGRGHVDLQYVMGMFVNTLALRNFPAADKTFRVFLKGVKEQTLEAFENQDYQFEDLLDLKRGNVERDISRNPLFDVMYVQQNVETDRPSNPVHGQILDTGITDFKLKPYDYEQKTSRFDLELEAVDEGHRILLYFEYCTTLFNKKTIERFVLYYKNILSSVLTEAGRDRKLWEIEILTEEEKKKILFNFNDTATEYPRDKVIHKIFEEQAFRVPGNIAVVSTRQGGTESVTYGELDKKSTHLAYLLKEKGVGLDGIVAIMAERSVEMIIGILGILKAGGAYLPVDPAYPPERAAYILADSNTGVLLTTGKLSRRVLFEKEMIYLENCSPQPTSEPLPEVHPGNLAYIIYTSGTTGKPKGMLIEHRNVVRLMVNDRFQFDFNAADVWTLFHSFCFDFSVWEMYGALLYGGKLVIIPRDVARDPGMYLEVLKNQQVTVLNQTPSAFYNLIEKELDDKVKRLHVKYVIFGGEALSPVKLKKWRDRYPWIKLINMFGITETTVHVTYKEIEEKEIELNISNIGKPIPTLTTYVLDRNRKLVPLGVPAELCVGGDGVGRGYLNRQELTTAKFIDNPFKAGDHLYSSGDLAKIFPDGEMEYLGRIDHQVKIRGFRIELAEIESQLLTHKNIKETVVLAKVDEKGDRYLCAYIVADIEWDVPGLRKYLAIKLPDYMIPTYFVPLNSIPLTSNGKVDRKALPEPEAGLGEGAYTVPRDIVEIQLARIWSEVLGIEEMKIGIDANFFEIGGHSFRAAVMAARIRKELKVDLPLAEIFKYPTLGELAAYIKGLSQYDYVSIELAEEMEYYPLSSQQKRLYFLQGMDDRGVSYNVSAFAILEGNLDKSQLEKSFSRLIERHESLRTSFQRVNEEPVQKIHKDVPFEIQYNDTTGLRVKGEVETERILKDFVCPFDLSQVPLLRVGLIKIKEERHILMVDMHHIVSDGVSMGLLIKEFMSFYSGEDVPGSGLPVTYKDFSCWQNSIGMRELLKQQEEYWLKEFEGEIPVMNLPTDFPRPVVQSFEGSILGFEIDKIDIAALKKYALEQNVTFFMVLLAVYNIFLSKLSNQEDIVVGTPVAGRRHTDLEHVVGMFVNTLALRNFPGGEKNVKQFLEEVKARTVESFSNQDYPYEELVENTAVKRDTSRNPLFDTMFAFQNIEVPRLATRDLKLEPYPYKKRTSKFDLSLNAFEAGDSLFLEFGYCTKLFHRETIERLVTYFKKVVSGVITDLYTKISGIEIIPEKEKNQLLNEFNNTESRYPKDKTVHELFEEQAVRTPGRVALVCRRSYGEDKEDVQLTYRELNKKSDQLAALLRSKGIEPGCIVTVMTEPSIEMMVGIMGVLKAGGCYLPMVPGNPGGRIAYILEDSETRLLVTQPHLMGQLAFNVDILPIESESLYEADVHLSGTDSSPDDPVYMIYTSGTTGKPKGVLLKHENLVNYATWFSTEAQLTCEDKTVLTSSFAFDLGYTTIYPSLLAGAQLHILPKETYMLPERLLDYICLKGISYLKMTPSLFSPLAASSLFSGETCWNLRLLVLGGEAINAADVEKAYRICSHLKIMNHYGPTEVTIGAIAQFVDADHLEAYKIRPTIGRPIFNTKVFILDRYHNLLPMGVAGELGLCGAGVAKGYFKRESLTSERFITNTFMARDKVGSPYDRVYLTGDLARWLPQRSIEFLGRIDHQIKIRGFRVELGEIESQLRKYERVKETVVTISENEQGDKYLCAYIVTDMETESIGRELREFLSETLPEYMIPAHFVPLEDIPLTHNGKVDRRALPAPEIKAGDEYIAPRTEVEEKLVEIWSEVLGIEKDIIGIHANFFQLGGHSLKATVMVGKVYKALNVDLPLAEIFKNPTIRTLAEYIKGLAEDKFVSIEPVEKKEYYISSSSQKRLYILQKMELESIAYNMPQFIPLPVGLDLCRIEDTINKLVMRHESFRTTFHMINNESVQRIHEEIDFEIEYFDFKIAREVVNIEDIINNFIRPFDLSKAPLLRVGLLTTNDGSDILLMDMHHIISDGISQDILALDFTLLYEDRELPPLRLDYKDYSQWQNREKISKTMKKQEEFWLNQFAEDIPVLNMPLDYERSETQSFEGGAVNFEISIEEANSLRKTARDERTTTYMILLAVFNVLLSKISGQEDIVVGSLAAGRRHPDLEHVIGMFVNTLALRNYPKGDLTFTMFLKDLNERTLTAFENQDYQFEYLVDKVLNDRDTSRNPLFDVVFDFKIRDGTSGRIETDGQDSPWKRYEYQYATAKFDLLFIVEEMGDNLYFTINYRKALFKRETIERFTTYFKNIVSSILADKDIKLTDIKIFHELVDAPISLFEEDQNDFDF